MGNNYFKILFLLLIFLFTSCKDKYSKDEIIVGSKKFTESIILGEIISNSLIQKKYSAIHKKELGGTRILWNALLNGEIHIYPDYTGTIIKEILNEENITDFENLKEILKNKNIGISLPLGFNNTYAIGMTKEKANKLNIKSISDLKTFKEFNYGFTNEFMDREDGWPGLQTKYNLPNNNVTGLDHDLAYRGLINNNIDVIDLYSTDAEIKYYDLQILLDDKNYFPNYNAVILYRLDLLEKFPNMKNVISQLQDNISDSEMINMNSEVKINRKSENEIAINFLNNKFNYNISVNNTSKINLLLKNTIDHLYLVFVSLFCAIVLAIPLGIISYKNKKFGSIILSAVGVIQTIPSLALLVFMIPLFGIGSLPAIIALFLYSLLPIVRNTYLGLNDIQNDIKESALVLGLSDFEILKKIEIPLAMSSIITGIKTSAVINVGTATLGALIGAGGYGQPILTGIRLDDISLILQGAIPAALLAVIVQFIFDLFEKLLVPKGLLINK